ncbi:MAG: NTP transferase domain-containing protein [Paracoccus sp. (in: a-proteobacteria)]|nr:NTP transferase domain-containing protein [Paracoccus sp. (in: a-proteobacteria)]
MPRSLQSVGGSVILERTIRNCLSCGISQFVFVLGHRSDQIRQFIDKTFRGIRVTYVINERYRETNTGYSLMLAAPAIASAQFILLSADLVFDVRVLRRLVDSGLSNVLCVDQEATQGHDPVKVAVGDDMQVTQIGATLDPSVTFGQAIGIDRISAAAAKALFAELAMMMETPVQLLSDYRAAYAGIIAKDTLFHAVDVTGIAWTRIDSYEGLVDANTLFGTPIKIISREQQRAVDAPAENMAALTKMLG